MPHNHRIVFVQAVLQRWNKQNYALGAAGPKVYHEAGSWACADSPILMYAGAVVSEMKAHQVCCVCVCVCARAHVRAFIRTSL